MATAQGERRAMLAGAKALALAAEPTITRAAYLALLNEALSQLGFSANGSHRSER